MRQWMLPTALTSRKSPERDIESDAYQGIFDEEAAFDQYLHRLSLVARFSDVTNGIPRHPKH